MSSQLVPVQGTEVLDPTEYRSVGSIARRLSTSLPPLMLGRVGLQVSKQRGKTVLALAALEHEMTLAEAGVLSRAQVMRTFERAALGLFELRIDCLLIAGEAHQRGRLAAAQLCDETRGIFTMGIDETALGYVGGVARRSREF